MKAKSEQWENDFGWTYGSDSLTPKKADHTSAAAEAGRGQAAKRKQEFAQPIEVLQKCKALEFGAGTRRARVEQNAIRACT